VDTDECTLLNGAVKIKQPAQGFRVGNDAVFAAAAVHAVKGRHVLDLGCGVGGITFCLLHRLQNIHVTGVELQPVYYFCAIENAALNNAQNNTAFIHEDIHSYQETGFDVVVTNPPYLEEGSFKTAPREEKNKAIGEGDLGAWLHVANRALKPGGQLVMIHRADHLQKIVMALGGKFGAVEVIPLYPRMGEPAKRVIIRALKGRRSPSIIHQGLTIHEADGYSEAAQRVLRDGEGL